MSAIIKPRIGNDRTPLQTVIPLSTPYLVFLDPSDKCNAKCGWCPTGNKEAKKYRKGQLMDWNLYVKIINDLCDMPEPIKTLRLYMMGEPLLNDALPEMIQYAKDSGRFGQIDTTTNGYLLTKNWSECLVDAGLKKVFISVPINYNLRYYENVKYFFEYSRGKCKVFVKIIGDTLTNYRQQVFLRFFSSISDEISIEHLSPCWPEFDVGKVGDKGIYGQPISSEVQVCPYIFYSLAINSDGTVSLCFLDWKHEMIIGDLKRENFKDIWNSNRLRSERRIQLKGHREILKNCRDCGQLIYGQPDDIDQYANEILERMK